MNENLISYSKSSHNDNIFDQIMSLYDWSKGVKVCNCYNLIRFFEEFIRMINYLIMKKSEVKDLKKPKFGLGLQIKYFQVAC